MKKGKRPRNRLRKHLFGDNSEVVIYRSLPDLLEEGDMVKSRPKTQTAANIELNFLKIHASTRVHDLKIFGPS